MRRLAALVASLLIGCAACRQIYRPFDPGALKGPRHGPQNELIVLGSPHLSQMKTLDPATLGLLRAKLAAWHPQAIAIEALSGPQCDYLRSNSSRYKDTVDTYCWDPAPARAATGLDVPGATAEADRLLAAWPATPTPAQRRRLAALFLAGGEQASALVQWLQVPAAERHAGDGLDRVLVDRLTTLETRHDESLLIAARLAADLGLQRVTAMDDHTSDSNTPDDQAAGEAIGKAWDNPATAARRTSGDALEKAAITPEGMLALYRAYNAPDQAKLTFDSDFGATLEEPSPRHYGRMYLAGWETRNLRMASNIRDMLSARPGQRALVIVGASHKGYLEGYLDQMHDIRIVDVETVLR